jgi:hypothetical protein
MNELSRQLSSRPTTQAAQGAPRLRWTLAEFERLIELGIFTDIGWRPPGADTYLESDLLISPIAFKGVTVATADVLLAVEIAQSSLKFDTTNKGLALCAPRCA